ncbi:hypothetical protein JXL19_07315 [bacterium]|nr:hypothetical protein [bacterium]
MVKERKFLILLLALLMISVLPGSRTAMAQSWQALPPYNLMWPLWSPVLSPPDPVTGIPTPLISELSRNTILPVQPVLAMNPYGVASPMGDIFPYLFYNSPGGVVFFDMIYGLNPWPPASFLDSTGAPIPLTLPPDFTFYAVPTWRLSIEYQYFVDLANLSYLIGYGNALGVNPSSLLTYSDIWGLPVI